MAGPAPYLTGLGAVTALGPDVGALWRGVRIGARALAAREDLGAPGLHPPVGSVAGIEGAPRALALAEIAARAAIADAGWDAARVADPETALVVATTKAGVDLLADHLRGLRPAAALPESLLFALAPALARRLGLRGPVRTVSVACASGLAAIGVARGALARGDAARALVVGADALTDFIVRGFSSLRALDPAGARPFDRDRAGLSVGEGAVAVTLEAEPRGAYGVRVEGYGASNDANHITGPARDGRGLFAALQDSLRGGGVEGIAFAVAHGTGTAFNDAMEAQAYRRALPGVPLTGVKGAIGHLMGAAGLANVVVGALGLREGSCPPVSGLAHLDPALEIDAVQGALRGVDGARAVVSASGFAGVNAAVVLAVEPPARAGRAAALRPKTRALPEPAPSAPAAAWVTGVADLPPDRAALVARVGARAARRLDDLCLFGLAAARAALEDAGCPADRLGAAPHGLVLGTALGCLESDVAFYRQELDPAGPSSNPRIFAYTLPNIVLGELAIREGLRGENLVFTAGAASGLTALAEAAARVKAGAWARALVLVVDAVGPAARALEAGAGGPTLAPRAAALLLEAPGHASGPARGQICGRVEASAQARLPNPGPRASEPAVGQGDPLSGRLSSELGAGGLDEVLRALREGRAQARAITDPVGFRVRVQVAPP